MDICFEFCHDLGERLRSEPLDSNRSLTISRRLSSKLLGHSWRVCRYQSTTDRNLRIARDSGTTPKMRRQSGLCTDHFASSRLFGKAIPANSRGLCATSYSPPRVWQFRPFRLKVVCDQVGS